MIFVSIIDSDVSDNPIKREPKKILVETCSYLIQLIHDIYQRQQNETCLVADPVGMDALYRALSARIRALPKSRKDDIDGCTKLLLPPDTSGQILPSTVAKEVEDFFSNCKKMGEHVQDMCMNDKGEPMSVDELREDRGSSFLVVAMTLMYDGYTFEQCLDAFFHPVDQDYDVDKWISEFADSLDDDKGPRTLIMLCAFAGIVRALKECNETGETKDYEEEEPEIYEWWTDSWEVNKDKFKKNDVLYCVKIGSILEHAEYQARKMVEKPQSGTIYSLPHARFHQDMSNVEVHPKAEHENVTPDDIIICRAEYDCPVDVLDVFHGHDGAYSSKDWSHDGTIGFCHTGSGWKNRAFFGHIYSFDGRGFQSKKLRHEFWENPNCIHADATKSTVWIHADERIKGFSTDGSTNYIFNILSKPRASATSQSVGSSTKRQKLDGNKREGCKHLMVLGDCIGYLAEGVLQEWKMNEANRHDGRARIIHLANCQAEIDQYDKEEILDWSENTWMDDSGSAEASIGVKPDFVRTVDILTPSSIGYLPDARLSFANIVGCQIPIYNHDLREVSRLVGFGRNGIEIVQRPTFEKDGDGTTFVASDPSCVKIFDLRSGKAEMTICQRCINSTPVYLSGAKFVLNKLEGGQGAMIWDLRAQKPLYSLPISGETDIAWVPATNGASTQPILLTDKGECYKYGKYIPPGDEDEKWEHEITLSAWSQVEKTRSKENDNCSIM